MTDDPEVRAAALLAVGRILRLASRPSRPGDVEEYERCRAVIMDASDPPAPDYRPNYARDRGRGSL